MDILIKKGQFKTENAYKQLNRKRKLNLKTVHAKEPYKTDAYRQLKRNKLNSKDSWRYNMSTWTNKLTELHSRRNPLYREKAKFPNTTVLEVSDLAFGAMPDQASPVGLPE